MAQSVKQPTLDLGSALREAASALSLLEKRGGHHKVGGLLDWLLLLSTSDYQQAKGLPQTSNKSVLLREWRGTINLEVS